MESKISEIFDLQDKLNGRFNASQCEIVNHYDKELKSFGEEKVRSANECHMRMWSDKFLSAAITEISETLVAIELNEDTNTIYEEMVDVLHFIVSSCLAVGCDKTKLDKISDIYENDLKELFIFMLYEMCRLREKTSNYSKWWKDKKGSLEELRNINYILVNRVIYSFSLLEGKGDFNNGINIAHTMYLKKNQFNHVRSDWKINEKNSEEL